ncbi:MAG TPA: tetratricopeptide repeat protein [Pirellulales bacterium]
MCARRLQAIKQRKTPASETSPDAAAALHSWLPLLGIVCLTFVAYVPALSAGWIWDDDHYVTKNPLLRTPGGLLSIWLDPAATPQYYPLVYTTFWLEYHVWRLAPLGYHLVNLLLHAANAVLAYRVLRLLMLPGALLAALIFSVHPVEVETVAWVTERKNLLSTLFYLGALGSFLRYWPADRSEPAAGANKWYLASLLMYSAALLSKTVTCSLPAAILLLRWWKIGHVGKRAWLMTAPMFAVGGYLAVITVVLEKYHVGAVGEPWDLSFASRLLIAGRALWFYLAKLAWPGNLIFIYPRWHIDPHVPWQWAWPIAFALLLAGCLVLRRRIGRGPLAALLLFAGTLLPALGFFDTYPMRFSFVADHFQYLASLACIAAFSATLAARLGTQALRAVSLVIVILLVPLAWHRIPAFRDDESLWNDTLAKNPDAWMAHNNLATLLAKQGKYAAAAEHYARVVQINPGYPQAHANLASQLAILGRPREAEAQFREALRLAPHYAEAHYNYGTVLAKAGKYAAAKAEYERAVHDDPLLGLAQYNLAVLLLSEHQPAEAAKHFHAALRAGLKGPDVRRSLEEAMRLAAGEPNPEPEHPPAATPAVKQPPSR